ncbi:hypothetical protein F5Y04DRAFT_140966 [Hypomontagnella monticulosa]|nr:hypothetical protein F5Y04DRAFT_140966 [Hypomontagnella monticulosa]
MYVYAGAFIQSCHQCLTPASRQKRASTFMLSQLLSVLAILSRNAYMVSLVLHRSSSSSSQPINPSIHYTHIPPILPVYSVLVYFFFLSAASIFSSSCWTYVFNRWQAACRACISEQHMSVEVLLPKVYVCVWSKK